MIEIRLHGRGGQGAVTAATILAKAAGYDGKYAQGFPAFGCERRGAPVKAFCRISEEPINVRSQVYEPDYAIVLDSSLMGFPDVKEGLGGDSLIVVNSNGNGNCENCSTGKTVSYDATSLAIEVLGKPIANTAMLGTFAGITGLVSLESLLKAVEDLFPGKVGEANKELVTKAYKGAKE